MHINGISILKFDCQRFSRMFFSLSIGKFAFVFIIPIEFTMFGWVCCVNARTQYQMGEIPGPPRKKPTNYQIASIKSLKCHKKSQISISSEQRAGDFFYEYWFPCCFCCCLQINSCKKNVDKFYSQSKLIIWSSNAFVRVRAYQSNTMARTHSEREREWGGVMGRYCESGIAICMFHSNAETKWSARTIDKFTDIAISMQYMRVLKQKLPNCK